MRILQKISDFLRRKNNIPRSDSRTRLLDSNSNVQAGYDQDDQSDYHTFNAHRGHHLLQHLQEHRSLQDLAESLGGPAAAASGSSVDGPQSDPDQHSLIQRSAPIKIPKPPADLDRNLQQHLSILQEVVCNELRRLGPTLEAKDLKGQLINCYHCQIFNHLNSLLPKVNSVKNCFVLMNWGLKTYPSQDVLGHPDLGGMDPMKHMDLLLLSEWAVTTKNKLLEKVQEELRSHLENILQHDRQQHSDSDEAFVQTYVDIIGCIAAMPHEAQNISCKLSYEVNEVCFQELHKFVGRYRDEQSKVLKKTAKADKPEMMHLFKTLKTCQELTGYVHAHGDGIRRLLCVEIEKVLKDIEDMTWDVLRNIVRNVAKKHLQFYFRSEKKQFNLLIEAVTRMFPPLENCDSVRKTVTHEVYEIIIRSYIKHLLKTKREKLQRCWSDNVAEAVHRDADLLHASMSALAPNVDRLSSKLEKITEVLACSDRDALKLTVLGMQEESLTASEDLHRLLRWKGLSTREVRVVLDAIPDDYLPVATSGAWCSCLGAA